MYSVVERFLRYVKIDTQSDDSSDTVPSTLKQLNLGNLLVKELQELGLKDAAIDQYGYVMATLPSNGGKKVPVIGFLAHMDTSPSSPGAGVNPQIVEKYDGGAIVLNKTLGLSMSPSEFPVLNRYIGQSIITTDGTTLLGGDDKAGIAEIMAAAQWMIEHPEFKHGSVKFGFTIDEEIGRGVDHFDVSRFGADYGYTLDGEEVGIFEYENFNAAAAHVTVHGRQVHPGSAKNIMKNSILMAMEFHQMLPISERPENTEKREGFVHLDRFEGTVETSKMVLIVRDHDKAKFEFKKKLIRDAGEYLNSKFGPGSIEIKLTDSYYNMKEKIEPEMHLVETALKAMRELGIEPKLNAVRGGTDGARLSYMGLPCPNFFAGAENFHSRFEFVPIPSMEKAVAVVLKIIELYAN
jgi:tripeptide aminopeptidase